MTMLRDNNIALSLVEFKTLLLNKPESWNASFLEQARFDLPRMDRLPWNILPDAVTIYPDDDGLFCYDW